MKIKYRQAFMDKLLDTVNIKTSVEEFRKAFNIKDMLYRIESAWERVEEKTLKNCWHKL